MYKVIIADDEQIIREKIESFIKRLPTEFEVIGQFSNGYDVLTNGSSLKPDILITDVKMPFVNGLSLIKEMKQDLPLLKCIIISGYDDFDYAKQAIDLGVSCYLMKPVTFQDLQAALEKVKSQLDSEKTLYDGEVTNENAAIQTERTAYKKIIQESDFNKLVTFKTPPDSLKQKIIENGLDLRKQCFIFVVFDGDDDNTNSNYEIIEKINMLLDELIEREFSNFDFSTFINQGQTCLALCFDEAKQISIIQDKLQIVLAEVQRATKCSISAGISEIGNTKQGEISYRKLFRHGRWALEYRIVVGKSLVLSYTDIQSTVKKSDKKLGKVDDNEFSNLSYSILYSKKADSMIIVEKILRKMSAPEFKETSYLILNNMLDTILKSCSSIDILYAEYMPHVAIVNEIFSIKKSSDLLNEFEELIDKVIAINDKYRSRGIDEAAEQICHYIEANYKRNDLSLDDVAEELSYSVSYISAILKKSNTSFTKYLTSIRMQNAKELLSNKKLSVLAVANIVGYDDPYYFSHCFKKFYNISPAEFRKNEKQ